MQLDISAELEIESETLESTLGETESELECSVADNRTTLGPFGLAVLADELLSELTPIYFRLAKTTNGTLKTLFCVDESRFAQLPNAVPITRFESIAYRYMYIEGYKYSIVSTN